MGTGAPRAPFLVARGVPSLRAAGGANVGSVSSGDRGGRALGVRCAIQRRPRSPGFAVAWLCGCAQWHTSGHGRPSSLRTVDGTTTRVSLRARQRGGRGSTGSEVGCVCVCVCVCFASLRRRMDVRTCAGGHTRSSTRLVSTGPAPPLGGGAAGGGAVAGCACTHIVAGGAVGAPSAPSHLLDRKKVVAGRRRELAIVCPWVIGRGGSYTSTAVTGIFTPARSTVVKKERRQPAGPQSFPRARVRRDEAPA